MGDNYKVDTIFYDYQTTIWILAKKFTTTQMCQVHHKITIDKVNMGVCEVYPGFLSQQVKHLYSIKGLQQMVLTGDIKQQPLNKTATPAYTNTQSLLM